MVWDSWTLVLAAWAAWTLLAAGAWWFLFGTERGMRWLAGR